jgi:hypothetical protein
MLHQCHVADGGLVHEGKMGQVEQVVVDQLPIALGVQIVGPGAPVGIVEPVVIDDLRRIGERRIAHPDPQPFVALDHRIGFHLGGLRDHVLARHAHALAGAVEAQAVIVALQHVAFDELAHRQRQAAVRTAVLQRDGGAVLGAVEHDRLAEDDAAERLAPDLVIHGGDVPGIAQEHGSPRAAWIDAKIRA